MCVCVCVCVRMRLTYGSQELPRITWSRFESLHTHIQSVCVCVCVCVCECVCMTDKLCDRNIDIA